MNHNLEYRVTVLKFGLVEDERVQYGRITTSRFFAAVQSEVTPVKLSPRIEIREVGPWREVDES